MYNMRKLLTKSLSLILYFIEFELNYKQTHTWSHIYIENFIFQFHQCSGKELKLDFFAFVCPLPYMTMMKHVISELLKVKHF